MIVPNTAANVNEIGLLYGLLWPDSAERAWHRTAAQWTTHNLSTIRPLFFAAFQRGREVLTCN